MEGQQANSQVGRNQSLNPEVLRQSMRPRPPYSKYGANFVTSVQSDEEGSPVTTRRTRAQRGQARGGEGSQGQRRAGGPSRLVNENTNANSNVSNNTDNQTSDNSESVRNS